MNKKLLLLFLNERKRKPHRYKVKCEDGVIATVITLKNRPQEIQFGGLAPLCLQGGILKQ